MDLETTLPPFCLEAGLMVSHLKEARKKNENLIALRIPRELSVTLRKIGINPKEAFLKALYEIAKRNSLSTASKKENPILSPFLKMSMNFWCGRRDSNP